MSGTPKSIDEAIRNGITAGATGLPEELLSHLTDDIRKHVKDFIAQKANLDDASIEFFKKIFPEVGPRTIEDLTEEELKMPCNPRAKR